MEGGSGCGAAECGAWQRRRCYCWHRTARCSATRRTSGAEALERVAPCGGGRPRCRPRPAPRLGLLPTTRGCHPRRPRRCRLRCGGCCAHRSRTCEKSAPSWRPCSRTSPPASMTVAARTPTTAAATTSGGGCVRSTRPICTRGGPRRAPRWRGLEFWGEISGTRALAAQFSELFGQSTGSAARRDWKNWERLEAVHGWPRLRMYRVSVRKKKTQAAEEEKAARGGRREDEGEPPARRTTPTRPRRGGKRRRHHRAAPAPAATAVR